METDVVSKDGDRVSIVLIQIQIYFVTIPYQW